MIFFIYKQHFGAEEINKADCAAEEGGLRSVIPLIRIIRRQKRNEGRCRLETVNIGVLWLNLVKFGENGTLF